MIALTLGQLRVELSITNVGAAQVPEQQLEAHDLAVKITYSGPNNKHCTSDGSGIMSTSRVS